MTNCAKCNFENFRNIHENRKIWIIFVAEFLTYFQFSESKFNSFWFYNLISIKIFPIANSNWEFQIEFENKIHMIPVLESNISAFSRRFEHTKCYGVESAIQSEFSIISRTWAFYQKDREKNGFWNYHPRNITAF